MKTLGAYCPANVAGFLRTVQYPWLLATVSAPPEVSKVTAKNSHSQDRPDTRMPGLGCRA